MNEEIVKKLYSECNLCPRGCHTNRYDHAGFCAAGTKPKLARAALHMWEEPALGGTKGSGAVFFSHCNLQCIFCQNYDISSEGFGKEISVEQLADIFLNLQEEGAANLDLVTATHYVPSVIAALDLVKTQLHIPVIYNCGGYENVETLRMLDGYVDIYLPDLKYYDDALAVKYSAAPHYYETAMAAIAEMIRQTGAPLYDTEGEGLLKRGTVIRHMVLPGCRKDSMQLLNGLKETFGTENYLISLLSQYTPFHRASEFREINRRITSFEYDSVVEHALSLGMDGFMQEKSSAKEEYTPDFSLQGI